jgi:hypothetical protein
MIKDDYPTPSKLLKRITPNYIKKGEYRKKCSVHVRLAYIWSLVARKRGYQERTRLLVLYRQLSIYPCPKSPTVQPLPSYAGYCRVDDKT